MLIRDSIESVNRAASTMAQDFRGKAVSRKVLGEMGVITIEASACDDVAGMFEIYIKLTIGLCDSLEGQAACISAQSIAGGAAMQEIARLNASRRGWIILLLMVSAALLGLLIGVAGSR